MAHEDLPTLRAVPMTEALARETADWHYDGAYAIYDQPAWATMVARGWGQTVPTVRAREFVALVDAHGVVAGFLRFMHLGDELHVGVGLRPDLCGRGLGVRAMALVDDEVLRRRGPGPIHLEVRRFNQRAVRCYERAGWRQIGVVQRTTALGPGEFVAMERTVSSKSD